MGNKYVVNCGWIDDSTHNCTYAYFVQAQLQLNVNLMRYWNPNRKRPKRAQRKFIQKEHTTKNKIQR